MEQYQQNNEIKSANKEEEGVLRPYEEPVSSMPVLKCPACAKRFRASSVSFFPGDGILNCTTNVAQIVVCPECGMRLPNPKMLKIRKQYKRKTTQSISAGSGKKYVGETEQNGLPRLLMILVVCLLIVFGVITVGHKRAERTYEAALSEYYQQSYADAYTLFNQSNNDDSSSMLAWYAASGLLNSPDMEKAKSYLKKASQKHPYTWAVEALIAQQELENADADRKNELRAEILDKYQKSLSQLTQEDDRLFCTIAKSCEQMGGQEARTLEAEALSRVTVLNELELSWEEAETQLKEYTGQTGTSSLDQMDGAVSECAYYLGNCFWSSKGSADDDERALVLWSYAAVQGNTDALLRLAEVYRNGGKPYDCQVKLKVDEEMAYRCVSTAAQQNDSTALALQGSYLINGIGTGKERTIGIDLLGKALKAGNGYAAVLLGDAVSDADSRLEYYRIAYEEYGCTKGLVRLAECRLDGLYGMKKNESKGWEMMLTAAQDGDTEALLSCGAVYYRDRYLHTGDTEMETEGLRCLARVLEQRDERYSKAVQLLDTLYHVQTE